jgi:outer membrane protein OmpA-like peptidoglycan-associated protein
LTQTRANIFTEKLTSAGVANNRVEAKGFGAALPVVPNSTNANRVKNRRMQVILIPNIQ